MPHTIAWYASSMSEVTIAREAIAHSGRRLEYFTIAWNTLEGLIGIGAGLFAGSISLVGFGMDSFIEVTSGAALLWRMSVDKDVERRERNEKLSAGAENRLNINAWPPNCLRRRSSLMPDTRTRSIRGRTLV